MIRSWLLDTNSSKLEKVAISSILTLSILTFTAPIWIPAVLPAVFHWRTDAGILFLLCTMVALCSLAASWMHLSDIRYFPKSIIDLALSLANGTAAIFGILDLANIFAYPLPALVAIPLAVTCTLYWVKLLFFLHY